MGFIQQLSISHSGISITLFDEPLVRLYHTVTPYCTLQVDATGSIIASMPWLKNADNKPNKILLYALTVKRPTGKTPSIAIAEHITSNHSVFSIRNLFSKLREIEYQIYQQNVFPKLVITDNSKAIIQAVLNELNRETLEEYLKRIYGIIFEDQKTENTQKNQIRLCSYHILRNNYAKLKELTKDKSQMNFAQRVLGRLICCKSYAEAETIILNAAIVMTTPKTDYNLKKSYNKH